jgi:hypothetical protein
LLLKPGETTLTADEVKNPVDKEVDQTDCQEMKQLMEYIEDEDCRVALFNLWYCSRSRSRNT